MAGQHAILPILERRAEIEEAIRSSQVVVICGETGSGKTTQLPQICLAIGRSSRNAGAGGAGTGGGGLIGHTQPRRLAARAVAARIAEERGEALGGTVGVKVRFQDQTSSRTRIKVMTDGMLLAELASDPRLSAYDTLIIDEAHERSLNIDFLLGCVKQLLPKRPELRVIVTSATIDPRRFGDYFGGAKVIEVSGRTYPVEVRYHDAKASEDDADRVNYDSVADAVDELTSPRLEQGDILVFLPGERDIRLAGDAIVRRHINADILPLFSRLTNQEQDRIFHPSSGGRRRVILATNVAETSLTVPGIRYVVDCGLARMSRYDSQRKIQSLPVEPISRASADQRAGRCGRIAAGVCIRLFSEDSYHERPRFTEPEIRRTSLASVILRMKALGSELGSIESFPFIDPPDNTAIRDGYETLFELGAINEATPQAHLTPVGERMSRVPVDPRIARMLMGAEREGSLNEVITLAAVLSIQDPRERPLSRQDDADRAQSGFRHPGSDFLSLLKLWDHYSHAVETSSHGQLFGWCREHFLSASRMREWGEMIRQLRETTDDLELVPNPRPATDDAVHRALLTGLITNVACREGDGSFDYRGVRGNTVQIFPGSALFKKGPKWIMAAEVVQTTRLYARTVARIEPEWIEDVARHMFRRQLSDHHLDSETGEPSAWERVTLSGIVVVPRRRVSIASIDPQAARALLIRDGLALGLWGGPTPPLFVLTNSNVLEQARALEAKLRRRDVLISPEAIGNWFDIRLDPVVCDRSTLDAWRLVHEAVNPRVLMLSLKDVVHQAAFAAASSDLFPDSIVVGDTPCPLTYALSPGKDDDGMTLTVPLASLPDLTIERAAWLVPGALAELVQALLKTLPKVPRALTEQRGTLADIGSACADVLRFGTGSLSASLTEAIHVLYGLTIDPGLWSIRSLPSHLRLRVRVVDHTGREIAVDRDLGGLFDRLEGRIRKARAAEDRTRFERHGLTTWDFGDLPERVEGDKGPAFPALVDMHGSVSLTLLPSCEEANQMSALGLRRFFALACQEEVGYYLEALSQWPDMTRQFAQLGTTAELRDQLTCIIADRTFLENKPAITTQSQYEERLATSWGRLSVVAREVAETVSSILEPRSRVAHRLSGGTPRLWAESVADIREHAAYLMPRGFLGLIDWARLKHYPRYSELMRARLFALREDGSRAETEALQKFSPHWKRFTGWVAKAISAERASNAAAGEELLVQSSNAKSKPPLPPTRRTGATVNLDAGEWAMQPGHLPQAVEHYRWSLEELRITLFAPHLVTKPPTTASEVERLWSAVKVSPLAHPRAAPR